MKSRLEPLVIFDLDGTLLDTIGDLADAANSVLAAHGYPEHNERDYMDMVGAGIHELVRAMLPGDGFSDARVHQYVLEMEAAYQSCWAQRTRPYPGITDVLDMLTEAGCGLAILSNKPHVFTDRMVRTFLSPWSFEPVLGASADRPKKPDPGAARMIAAHHGLPPERCFLVGDSEPDIRTARNAGMVSVAVTWGFRTRERLEAETPNYMISHPGELPGIVNAYGS